MITDRIQSIAQKVQLLKRLDVTFSVFGSSSHQYQSIPLTGTHHQDLEQEDWPEDYVSFLRLVGSGAGPYYGILDVRRSTGEAERVSDDDLARLMIAAGATRNTIVPICDHGCGERFMLVVAGPRKGSLWFDHGFGDNSIEPFSGSFLDFYERWLDHSLSQQEHTI